MRHLNVRYNCCSKAVLPALLLLAAHPALAAPEASLGDLITGATIPLTLKLQDLDAKWRRMAISGAGALMGDIPGPLSQGLGGSIFYTRGQLSTVGTESYLIAYRLQAAGPDPNSILRPFDQGEAKPIAELTPETPLALALINLRSAGNLRFVEAVSVEQEIKTWHEGKLKLEEQLAARAGMQQGGPARRQDPTLTNLGRIGRAVKVYADQHDGLLPPMVDAKELAKALLPSLGDEKVLLQPGTTTPFAWNTVLSGQVKHNFVKAAETIIVYEAKPAEGAERAVLFLDGQTRRVNEAEWTKLKKISLMK